MGQFFAKMAPSAKLIMNHNPFYRIKNGDIFPKIGDVLLKIGQLGKMGLDMFDRFGKMYIQSTKMQMEMTKTISSKALNFAKNIANSIDSRLLNLQKLGEMQVNGLMVTNYMLKGDLGLL